MAVSGATGVGPSRRALGRLVLLGLATPAAAACTVVASEKSSVTSSSGQEPLVKDIKADFGAVGDGTADDSAALQRGFDEMGRVGGLLHFPPGAYRVTRNLYTWGGTSIEGVYGQSTVLLDSDLTQADGTQYWWVFGATHRGGDAVPWSGTLQGMRLSASPKAPTDWCRMIQLLDVDGGRLVNNVIDARPRGLSRIGGIFGGNDADWLTGGHGRRDILIRDNVLTAAQDQNGSEGIGLASASGVVISGNRVSGFGDDAIAVHGACTDFIISNNTVQTVDGRILVDGSTRGVVSGNIIERVATPAGAWVSGGSMLHCLNSASSSPAPADLTITGNVVKHGVGITSNTYGIRLEGVRRAAVSGNNVYSGNAFGGGIAWAGQAVPGWVDPEGVDADGIARAREITVSGNRFSPAIVTMNGAQGTAVDSSRIVHSGMPPVVIDWATAGLSTPNAGAAETYTYRLAADLTIAPPSLGFEDQEFTLKFTQVDGAAHTIGWQGVAQFRFTGSPPTQVPAGSTLELRLLHRGALWVEAGRTTY